MKIWAIPSREISGTEEFIKFINGGELDECFK